MKNQIILTGMRPTNMLTIGNYVGAIAPLLEMQKTSLKKGDTIFLFSATQHALTTHEPASISGQVIQIVGDYIAAGIDPEKVVIYDQMDLRLEINMIASYLSREVSVNRLLRLPTLKDKLDIDPHDPQAEEKTGLANVSLFTYPILMAADILCQDADLVPVGKDQGPHIELARQVSRRYNAKYGEVLRMPEKYIRDSDSRDVNILSLQGDGKMSKTKPDSALFLSDSPDIILNKIKRAKTGEAGQKSECVESLLEIANCICTEDTVTQLRDLYYDGHMRGLKVMANFKEIAAKNFSLFFEEFQSRRRQISDEQVRAVLESGHSIARLRAQNVLTRMEEAMGVFK